MPPAQATPLSKNDLAILGALFDPETSLSANSHVNSSPQAANTSSLPTAVAEAIQDKNSLIAKEKAAIEHLNKPSPTVEQIHVAISELSTLVDENPTYASAYTNRAQATRLLPGSLENADLLNSILSDLHAAISLTSQQHKQSQQQLTAEEHNRILATAHAHRAYLLLHASTNVPFFNLLKSLNLDSLGLSTPRSEVTQSTLEELASRDFAIAGRCGDEKARQMAVKTNPYAKLCGSIVREALREEIREFYEGGKLGGMGDGVGAG